MSNYYVTQLNSVIIQKSWSNIFGTLSDENSGKLIKALFLFMDGNEVEIEDKTLDGIFRMMSEQIENSARKYVIRAGLEEE